MKQFCKNIKSRSAQGEKNNELSEGDISILKKFIKEEIQKNRRLHVLQEASEMSCPRATQDLELNTMNRNRAIKAEHIKYGPLNLMDQDYWMDLADHWNTSEDVARSSTCGNCSAFDVSPRMDECMPGQPSDADGRLGYCWMHHFKCHSARTCYTWAAGGPIIDDSVSYDWQNRAESV